MLMDGQWTEDGQTSMSSGKRRNDKDFENWLISRIW